MSTHDTRLPEPIAIIGIGCRFPGANGPEAFWRLLADGMDTITEVPARRFDIEAFYDPTPGAPGKIVSRFGGFVNDIERFDSAFFGIAPREAEAMDPQQRILLEVAYEAMEDAGLSPECHYMSGTGVFVGITSNDYLPPMYRFAPDLDLTTATGGSRGTAAARISHAFGFEGPSLVVDSDRASSLAAIHLACRSLRDMECRMALAGAANAILGPELSIACSRSRILSPDGRCKFCDARADGIGRSDGFGVLVLKRLADALRNSDRVYALILGSAITHNGRSSIEMMRPSPRAQETLLRAALSDARVAPGEVQYVEAHGTGTRVGDQAETEALGAVLGGGRPIDRPCLIGSVKTNIGHAEGAAGMAGIIKVALALRHGTIPKSLHLVTPNPELRLEERRLRVQTETTPWPDGDGSRRIAGVSAFGLTGALAHVVLQEPPSPEPEVALSSITSEPMLLPLSARSPEALDALAEAYRNWLRQPSTPDLLRQICYSASVRRQHHQHRLGVVASSQRELADGLSAYLKGTEPYPGARGAASPSLPPKLAFVFPGQGGQWVGMGRELLAREPVFRDVIAACDEAVRKEGGWSVAALIRGEMDEALLDEIDYVQPTLTAVMVGLAALWRSWGIEPQAVIGFSMGEAAAAHVAGMLSIEDAIAVVCSRTRLMRRLRGKGAIASLPLSLADAEKTLAPYSSHVSVAVVSSPTTTTVSGDPSALRRLVDELETRGLCCRYVKVDVASHTVQVEGLLGELRTQLAHLRPRRGAIPMVSTVDDAYLAGPELDAEYWARNLRQPVLQVNGISRLLSDGFTAFLEVSPHPVAWTPLLETIRHIGANARAVASLRRDENEREALLKGLGALYACGTTPNWKALFRPEDRRFVPLPTYRWQGTPFLYEAAREQPASAPRTDFLSDLRGTPLGGRRELLSEHLQRAVARLLKLSHHVVVDRDAPLRGLGLTSLMATELALDLEGTLQHPCPTTIFFNYPTIDLLAERLLSEGVADSTADAGVVRIEALSVAASTSESMSVVADAQRQDDSMKGVDDSMKGVEPIAVVGLACRFPGGATSSEDYWRILRGGVDAITEVPADRWDVDSFYDPDPEAPGKMYTRWGGFLDALERFDAGYFGISPREAEVLDPQQRLLLEVAVEALEHAGYAPDPQRGLNASVFIGIMNNNDFVSLKGIPFDPSRVNAHDSTGQAMSAAAGRLSYALGLRGPSMAIDTACSSSLVAIHLACQALRAGECQIALAGGVNVILAPEITISFCKTRMLSPTGRCKTFDAHADGYVRGEGCGLVVLKRLSAALQDEDHILAVVRGSAVNQDGRSSSLTAPNGLAQQEVVRMALEASGIRPAEVDYVEAHGTGTAIGDPIEIEALSAVLREGRDARRPFLVGSVKTNIGHLEAAAGVAGLIKIILSLQNEEIPPHLHLEQINPRISLEASKAAIPTCLTPWPQGGKRRIAGISSFGFVGTNAHLIVEEAPEKVTSPRQGLPRPPHRMLGLSARNPESLRELAVRYGRMLSERPIDVDDLCYTANTGRIHHAVRAAFVGADSDDLRARIQAFAGGWTEAGITEGIVPAAATPKIAFLFTGQGAQYPRIGYQLLAVEPIFRDAVERCARIMDPLLPRPLLSILDDEDRTVLEQTRFAQPALFALEYAILEQWREWGVEPSMVMGHSLGEYVAAVAAGVLSLNDGARLAVARGRLMQSIQTCGGAAAVFASEEFVKPFVEQYPDSLAVAADNAPERVLIAGEQAALQTVCDALEAQGIELRRMTGLIAAHSPLMDPLLDAFESMGAMVTYHPPTIPLVSTSLGRTITQAEIGAPQYWRDHLRNKVRFREGIQALHEAGCRIFVEIGPRNTLIRLGEMCLPFEGLTWLSSLSKEKHDQQQMLESLAELYVRGVRVRWEERHRPFVGCRIPLPTTVFEKRRFWPKPTSRPTASRVQVAPPSDGQSTGLDALLGHRLRSPLEQVQFEARIDLTSLPLLEDHCVFDALVMPAAAHLVRVLAAAGQLTGRKRLEVMEALFPEPMVLCDDDDCRIASLVLTPNGNQYDFQITSTDAELGEGTDPVWRIHATGRVLPLEGGEESQDLAHKSRQNLIDVSQEQFSGEDFYAIQARRGYALGASFRWLERVWLGEREALAKLRKPAWLDGSWKGLHPGLIDSCLQVASRLSTGTSHSQDEEILVPAAVEGLRLFGSGVDGGMIGPIYCRILTLPVQDGGAEALTMAVFDEADNIVFSISKLHFRQVQRHDFLGRRTRSFDEAFRQLKWRESLLVEAEVQPGQTRGPGKTVIGNRLRTLPEEEQHAAILEYVVDIVRSVTAMDPSEAVRPEDRFDDLGVDSLLSLDLIDALNSSIGVSLPATILIDCPTIEMLTDYLVRKVDRAATAS
jgi:acyl transferase domain-containing protein